MSCIFKWAFMCYYVYVKLSKKKNIRFLIVAVAFLSFFVFLMKMSDNSTFADDGEKGDVNTYQEVTEKHVTFYDDGEKLTVKTDALTVEEALRRAGIVINTGDIVEPELKSEINMDNFFINIHRARPVVIKDGIVEKYIMTASYDYKMIAKEAGITIYDGDEVVMVRNTNFLENGVANIYEVTRNGGRTLTVEEEIPFTEVTEKDVSLPVGTSEVRQLGEVGTKRVYYNVLYVDGVEVSREKTSEEVIREPVARVVAVGARQSVRPEAETCAGWLREAGVSEADIEYAVQLIYRESGCRVDARNASSGAYGIPQALPGHKMAAAGADWETNPITQIRWMMGYVSRWGGWAGALQQQMTHGWY